MTDFEGRSCVVVDTKDRDRIEAHGTIVEESIVSEESCNKQDKTDRKPHRRRSPFDAACDQMILQIMRKLDGVLFLNEAGWMWKLALVMGLETKHQILVRRCKDSHSHMDWLNIIQPIANLTKAQLVGALKSLSRQNLIRFEPTPYGLFAVLIEDE